jgi:putative methionine-R-sulfoxide reductase with GAF domain
MMLSTEGADMEAGPAAEGSAPADTAVTIARQQAEIERLQRRVADERFAQDLRDALTLAATVGTVGAPASHERLLDMILATAADIIGAHAASLFLIDAEHEDLVFKVALGDKADEVKKSRIPLGQDVAGLVALTGQPMAISDRAADSGEAADSPKNVLCVPLFVQGQVIGVLELLDKEGTATFGADDMEALGLFANQAAVAIEQSRTQNSMGALVAQLIHAVDGLPDYERQGLTVRAREFTAELGQHSGYLHALELARLVQEIVHHGDRATESCKGILSSFVQFLRSRPAAAGEEGGISW